MTYEELKISIDLNGYENVLPIVGSSCLGNSHWFVVCDDGDCHLFDRYGNEDDISKIKEIYEYMIPKNIKKIVIPNNVTHIRPWAFYTYRELASVTIPDSVTNIDDYAFYNCSRLMSVTIPEGVTSIEELVFCGCSNLKSLIFKGKSLDKIRSMKNYPWGIKDESIIRCERL